MIQMQWTAHKYTHVALYFLVYTTLYVETLGKARRAILGIPLQWSCLMQRVVFLASHRLSPPPTPSPLLNWVSPCKCGGYKAETSSLPSWCMARSWESDFRPQSTTSAQILNTVTLPIHTDIVKRDHHHTSCSGQPTPCREGEMY